MIIVLWKPKISQSEEEQLVRHTYNIGGIELFFYKTFKNKISKDKYNDYTPLL